MSGLRRPRSLRARLTLIAALGAVVVLSVGSGVLYVVLTTRLDQALSTELAVRAGDVEAELAAGAAVSLGGPLPTQVIDASSGAVVAPRGEAALPTPEQLTAARAADDVEFDEGDQRLLVRSVVDEEGEDRLVVVAGSTASISQARNQLLAGLAVAGPLVLVGVTASAWMLTGAALSPVRSMTRRAASISVADPSERLPEPSGDDEIAELAETLNGMLDRITASVQHERAFIDDASHELRTPIAVLRGELELAAAALRRGDDADEVVAGVDSALEETDRLVRLAEQLLVLARIDAHELSEIREPVVRDLRAVVEGVVDRISLPVGIWVDVDVDPNAVPALDRDSLDRLLTNLVSNAARFADTTVTVTVTEIADRVVIAVADDGPGFPPPVLAQPFDRFVRADPHRTGTGLGLAIVNATARASDGDASLGNGGPLGGAWVRVDLPQRRR